MKIFNKTILTAALALCGIGTAMAQDAAPAENMYLIKGDRVIGKYAVDDVDYVSFKVPEGVQEESLWLTVDKVGKNNVTYTVNTIDPNATYAHGFVSYYDANYYAMDYYGDFIENLTEEEVAHILQIYIQYVGYLGSGTTQYTRTDWESDGFYNINVTPGTMYYLCAWEVDPVTETPNDNFVYDTFTTEEPGESSAELSVKFLRQNSEGLAFEISGSDDILYIKTVYGALNDMRDYFQMFGMDFLMGTFAETYNISDLQGMSNSKPEIEAATWPAYESGEYILMVRAYDKDGNVVEKQEIAVFVGEEVPGPEIKIFSKSKGDGKVSVNFEISPSNVEEAYVRMMLENDVNDYLNNGWELWELATSSNATDITDIINRDGEYTFKADGLDDQWYSLLIYAKDKDGGKTTQRINFNMLEDSYWDIPAAAHAPKLRKVAAIPQSKSRKPTIKKVK